MDFSTTTFWFAMLPAMLLIYLAGLFFKTPNLRFKFNKYCLAFLSLLLLYITSLQTLLIFLFVILLTYIACSLTLKLRGIYRKGALFILILLQLLPLLYYKYADFIVNGVFQQQWDTFRDLIIPVGLSFYTFQSIAFCIDTLKENQHLPLFIDYLNFSSFFPQIVAGPIERKNNLMPQMENLRLEWNNQNVALGLPFIILGLFFKMAMADNLASSMLKGYCGGNAFQIWLNNVCFGFRIYFDFAGYGLTAYGIAKCLGMDITINFLSPYTCCNISDFWRNWHRSLTQWFRDYIYFAMGGSRTKLWWFNIIIMFLVSGIWHGAGWNFIIWGALGGITMVIHRFFHQQGHTLPSFIGWFLTFTVVMFIWMFFYETNTNILFRNMKSIFTPDNYDIECFINTLRYHKSTSAIAFVFILISFFILFLEYKSKKIYTNPYSIFTTPHACMIMLILIFMLHAHSPSEFIYFAF